MPATRVIPIDSVHPDARLIEAAADVIRDGGLVAFPTETVYGLGADATSAAAVERIFVAKERDRADPLIVHIADMDALSVTSREVPGIARHMAERFWPGGLTMVLPRGQAIAPAVAAGGDTVAVRMPRHAVARALIEAAGVPIAAPSANRFMRTSATTASHVLEDLDGRIDLVLDGGPADAGIESTVVAFDADGVVILRPGAVTLEELREASPAVRLARGNTAGASGSPGMMERHYAPSVRLVYLPDVTVDAIVDRARDEAAAGRKVGLLLADGDAPGVETDAIVVERLGPVDDLERVASALFSGLRRLDAAGVDVILARGFPLRGRGLALDDRLRRASAPPDG